MPRQLAGLPVDLPGADARTVVAGVSAGFSHGLLDQRGPRVQLKSSRTSLQSVTVPANRGMR